jgi:hypothetical protein
MLAVRVTLRVPSGLQPSTEMLIVPIGQLLSHCKVPPRLSVQVGSVAQEALTRISPPQVQRSGISTDQFPAWSGTAVAFAELLPQTTSTTISTAPLGLGGQVPLNVPVT